MAVTAGSSVRWIAGYASRWCRSRRSPARRWARASCVPSRCWGTRSTGRPMTSCTPRTASAPTRRAAACGPCITWITSPPRNSPRATNGPSPSRTRTCACPRRSPRELGLAGGGGGGHPERRATPRASPRAVGAVPRRGRGPPRVAGQAGPLRARGRRHRAAQGLAGTAGGLRAAEPAIRPDVRLVIAGGETLFDYRDYRARWEQRAGVLGVSAEVLGPVPEADLPSLVAAAGVFAFPSAREGFGLAALEALAAGVPVVASDLPVLREVLGGAARSRRGRRTSPPGWSRPWAAAIPLAGRPANGSRPHTPGTPRPRRTWASTRLCWTAPRRRDDPPGLRPWPGRSQPGVDEQLPRLPGARRP